MDHQHQEQGGAYPDCQHEERGVANQDQNHEMDESMKELKTVKRLEETIQSSARDAKKLKSEIQARTKELLELLALQNEQGMEEEENIDENLFSQAASEIESAGVKVYHTGLKPGYFCRGEYSPFFTWTMCMLAILYAKHKFEKELYNDLAMPTLTV